MRIRTLHLTVGTWMFLAFSIARMVAAQAHAVPEQDSKPFACLEDGLAHGEAYGCQLLARPTILRHGDDAVFWHLRPFRRQRDAEAIRREGEVLVTAGGRTWLVSFGARSDGRGRGARGISVGPLPLPPGREFLVELYHVQMPAKSSTAVHIHPGPEAWYILEGSQCLETPDGTLRAKAGGTSIAAPSTPMQLTNNGSGVRRALFVVVHDPSLPWAAPSNWRPTGACAS